MFELLQNFENIFFLHDAEKYLKELNCDKCLFYVMFYDKMTVMEMENH